ncbi:MAG TPA: helix-turn-helix domain-containing protein [Thermoanaerobaculia bacterium]|nr:helix-turn-helix domain-containing protein [Thermoanaerobaculia bacterium]
MLGETVREARIRKNLTQARLAKLAGVSRRHLAALEKGANVSVNILQRVASVLELAEIQIGDLSLRSKDDGGVNVPLLTDTIREARAEAERAHAILARAENILGLAPRDNLSSSFPKMPIRRIDAPQAATADILRERPDYMELELSGEIRHGYPIDESKKDHVAVPKALIDEGEIVFRVRGDSLFDHGISDGDLLVVELRQRGRAANGELVIGRIGSNVYIGRWWNKHGRKALMSHGLSEVTVARSARSLRVVAAINQIIRL